MTHDSSLESGEARHKGEKGLGRTSHSTFCPQKIFIHNMTFSQLKIDIKWPGVLIFSAFLVNLAGKHTTVIIYKMY